MHAGSFAPRLAAPPPSVQTVMDNSPPVQVNILISTGQSRRAQGCPRQAAFCVESMSTI